ncbi:hypothetical protein HF086_007657 [Spodoptera exigua]|uniref:CD80-like immunoglobulin C2-set domain-containing protein n=1 Tax=Spodoptera exigua TaxID=7107 RepID=A0A922MB98_SPOEX|nr:hypothetical protein HF086_007657 [Spodoptera exigua]
MTVGTTSYRLIPENLQGDVVYTGQGLKAGQCGALIKNIKEEWNGNITCVLPPPSGNIELVGSMRLLVATPGEIQLNSSPQPPFKEGDTFMAQCVVPNGRPAAKITWFLDPPKRQETGTVTIFGLKLGAEGKLNVTVKANPTISRVEHRRPGPSGPQAD